MEQINKDNILVRRTGRCSCSGCTLKKTFLSGSPKISWFGLRSCLVMTCRAKDAPLENLRSCDRSLQSPLCADGCLASDVYLDIFTSWCLQQSACTYFILLKLHDLSIQPWPSDKVWAGKHSNLGSNPNRTQGTFAQILHFWDVIIMCYYAAIITRYYKIIIACYYKLLRIQLMTHYSIIISYFYITIIMYYWYYYKAIITYCNNIIASLWHIIT